MTLLRLPDYHVHSRFSDGVDELDACVERALELGLPELGFADHLTPACLAEDGHYGIHEGRLDDYVEAVLAVAAAYPELRVLLGIEADYLPEAAEETLTMLASYPFDYVLCAVHFVEGFGFIESRRREAEGWRNVDRVWQRYYETLTEATQTGAFDVVAHLDLPKKWGFRPSKDISELEHNALLAIAAAGMAIEINTAGLDRHPAGEMYPALSLLRRARAAGIALTFGSDAHRAAEVGAHFAEAREWARAAGYETWLRLSDWESVALL
ncbi:MAG TPA: histidinol-phosphatase [Candidatus Limnocylindrales bacterium]